jgi:hypothetical protein
MVDDVKQLPQSAKQPTAPIKKAGRPTGVKKEKPSVITVNGIEYVPFNTLHKLLCVGLSAKTFKKLLEAKGVQPTLENGQIKLYDLNHVKSSF